MKILDLIEKCISILAGLAFLIPKEVRRRTIAEASIFVQSEKYRIYSNRLVFCMFLLLSVYTCAISIALVLKFNASTEGFYIALTTFIILHILAFLLCKAHYRK